MVINGKKSAKAARFSRFFWSYTVVDHMFVVKKFSSLMCITD